MLSIQSGVVKGQRGQCLSVAVVFCILLIIDNEGGEVWNVKAMNLRTGSVTNWESTDGILRH